MIKMAKFGFDRSLFCVKLIILKMGLLLKYWIMSPTFTADIYWLLHILNNFCQLRTPPFQKI